MGKLNNIFDSISQSLGANFVLLGLLLYIELFNSFLIGPKRTVSFQNQRPWRHNGRLNNNQVKDTQSHG